MIDNVFFGELVIIADQVVVCAVFGSGDLKTNMSPEVSLVCALNCFDSFSCIFNIEIKFIFQTFSCLAKKGKPTLSLRSILPANGLVRSEMVEALEVSVIFRILESGSECESESEENSSVSGSQGNSLKRFLAVTVFLVPSIKSFIFTK